MLGSDKSFTNLLPLGVTAVDRALDWSWLVDLGQGNFEQAKSASELALLGQWHSSTLFARGIVHRLQGEFTFALSMFEEAYSCADSPEQKLIIATTACLTQWQGQEIFFDSFFAERQPLNSEWVDRLEQLQQQQLEHLSGQLESNLLSFLGSTIPKYRTLIVNLTGSKQTQTSQGGVSSTAQQQLEEVLQNIQQELIVQLELYQNLEIFAIAQLLYSLLAELLALAGQYKSAWEILAKLINIYQQSEQYLATAWYLLCQGDLICSIAPWGKPIFFGYHLIGKITSKSWDRSLIDRANAQELYLKARQYFTKVGAERGEGMVILRLAYLNAVAGQWNLANYGYQEAQEYFTATGDRLNLVAAQMGKWWTLLYYQELDRDCLLEIEELIRTLKQDGAIAWGLSWGLVFAYGAKEAWDREQDLDVALRLATVAETIMNVFAEEAELLARQSYQQLWQDFNDLMAGFYNELTDILAQEAKWTEALTLAEIARAYSLRAVKALNQRQPISWLTIEEVIANLPPDTLILSYLVTAKHLLAWAITSRGLMGHYLLSDWQGKPIQSDKIRAIKNKWLKTIQQKSINPKINLLFCQNLLQPFEQIIQQAQHLVIIPGVDLQWLPFETLLWNEQFLGEQKSVSYLLTLEQLLAQSAQISLGALIVTDLDAIASQRMKARLSPNIDMGIARIIAELYEVHLYSGKATIPQELQANISNCVTLIHLFLEDAILPVTELQTPVVAISVRGKISGKILTTLIGQLIDNRVKTVIINRYLPNEIAVGMLLVFFHLNWRSGLTIAQSLWQAQQQLSQVTVQEALDFCQMIQHQIPWQPNSDRVNRAMLVKYMGEILAFGGDYRRAIEAYQVTINIFNDCGYIQEANLLHNQYILWQSLAQNPSIYKPEKLIYNSPEYWSSYLIIGNWQLSINQDY